MSPTSEQQNFYSWTYGLLTRAHSLHSINCNLWNHTTVLLKLKFPKFRTQSRSYRKKPVMNKKIRIWKTVFVEDWCELNPSAWRWHRVALVLCRRDGETVRLSYPRCQSLLPSFHDRDDNCGRTCTVWSHCREKASWPQLRRQLFATETAVKRQQFSLNSDLRWKYQRQI